MGKLRNKTLHFAVKLRQNASIIAKPLGFNGHNALKCINVCHFQEKTSAEASKMCFPFVDSRWEKVPQGRGLQRGWDFDFEGISWIHPRARPGGGGYASPKSMDNVQGEALFNGVLMGASC